jgi:hypothetical protein
MRARWSAFFMLVPPILLLEAQSSFGGRYSAAPKFRVIILNIARITLQKGDPNGIDNNERISPKRGREV